MTRSRCRTRWRLRRYGFNSANLVRSAIQGDMESRAACALAATISGVGYSNSAPNACHAVGSPADAALAGGAWTVGMHHAIIVPALVRAGDSPQDAGAAVGVGADDVMGLARRSSASSHRAGWKRAYPGWASGRMTWTPSLSGRGGIGWGSCRAGWMRRGLGGVGGIL